jgi:hypothetical protein
MESDILNEKLCLIADVFKVGSLLDKYDKPHITPAGQLFDTLYDKSIQELELLLAVLSAHLKLCMKSAVKLH